VYWVLLQKGYQLNNLMKNNILIFCSWLDLDSNVGVFFREQAELVAEQYNPILVVFKSQELSKKRFNYFNILNVEEKYSKEGLLVLEITFPYKKVLPLKINDYFKSLVIKSLRDYLVAKNISISFIHAQSIFDGGIWAFLYSNQYKTPYIITEHNQLSFYNVSKEKCLLVAKSLQNSTLNIAVSNDKIRQFVSNRLFFDFKNIGNLINKRFFYNSEILKNKTVRFITIGAFSPLKDQITLLKALEIVDKQLSTQIEFVWIGQNGWGTNQDENVRMLLSNFKYENIDVILEPLLERDEIVAYLRSSHLFLFSSLTEGMPVSVLEALACGLPVFTTNCGGVDELIEEENGKIYQIRDYLKLSELIFEFLNLKLNYDSKIISAKIIEKFGEDAFRKKLLEIYKSIE
jgi:glycosyltransferase involved in cell wall biosynthesis